MAHYDVAIIGGGLVGCASAYYLAKAGASAIVIEQDQINAQASGQNAGSLHFQLEHRLVEYGDKLIELVAQAIPLSNLAIEAWAGLEAELGEDLEINLHGGLMIAESADQVVLLQKKFAAERKYRLPTELLDAEGIVRHAPYLTKTAIAAGYCQYEGHANPRLVTPAYARRAQALGAVIKTGIRVSALRRVRDGWHVEGRGAIGEVPFGVTAGKILNACGAWAGKIGNLVNIHLPIFPVPLTMSVTESAPPIVGHLIQHVGRRLSLKQVRDGNFLIGGGWPSRFQDGPDGIEVTRRPAQLLDSILRNAATACDVVPGVRDFSIIRSWTGIVGVAADQLPLLGEVSCVPGFFVAAGGSGFTLGPVYAQAMANMMLERDSGCDLSVFSPDRFDHINVFMGSR